jgi:LysR family transcriptional regulator, regulator for bpeEF and oprC
MMELPDLKDLSLFCRVVQEGSFAGAARRFGSSKATVSRRVALLEQSLGAQLLIRTTRTVKPTELGRDFYSRAIGILAAADDALASVKKTRGEPSGLLRITAGVEFGVEFLSPLLSDYLTYNTQVSAELDLTGRFVDLVYEEFDLGIRVGPLGDSSLSSRKLGSFRYGVFASPSLIRKQSRIQKPSQLAGLPALVFKRPEHTEHWVLLKGHTEQTVKVTSKLTSNNHWALRRAAVAGLGFVFGPTFLMKEDVQNKRLVQILPEWGSTEIAVHAVFPAQKFLAPKVRRFVDHLVMKLNF